MGWTYWYIVHQLPQSGPTEWTFPARSPPRLATRWWGQRVLSFQFEVREGKTYCIVRKAQLNAHNGRTIQVHRTYRFPSSPFWFKGLQDGLLLRRWRQVPESLSDWVRAWCLFDMIKCGISKRLVFLMRIRYLLLMCGVLSLEIWIRVGNKETSYTNFYTPRSQRYVASAYLFK